MNGLRCAWVIAVLSLCGIVTTPVRAEIATTGDTKDDGSTFYAGYNANTTGDLTIDAGSVFSRDSGYLGYNSGSTGTAIITGARSMWINSGVLYVGKTGSGTLQVEAGGRVSGGNIILGESAGSTGTAIITGVGSAWSNYGDLYDAPFVVGWSGSGTLRVEAGGQVSNRRYGHLGRNSGSTGTAIITGAGSKWTNSGSLYIGESGSGTLRVEAGGQVATSGYSDSGYLGYYSGSTGTAIITGAGSKWTNTYGLFVGYGGSGTLRVEAGAQVSNPNGFLGNRYGSTGTVVITGAGSKWTNSGNLSVGYQGSGTLRVEAGGQVSNTSGYLGSIFMATAIITGAGSKWTNSGDLSVGNKGSDTLATSGSLTISDGGQVTARSLSIAYYQSTVRLHVSGDRMLLLGNASTKGSISNSGKLSLLADAFLPADTYRPIGEFSDQPLTWSGSGSISVVGGAWDSSAKTFTVIPSTSLDAGTSAEVSSGMRLLITDPASGDRAGVSFGTLASTATLTSLSLPQTEQATLLSLLASDATILIAWSFTGQLAGGEALLSFKVKPDAEDLHIWRLTQAGWSEYTPDMLTYDSNGIVSFTVDPASLNSATYAVSGIVPEPAGLSLLAFAMFLIRRRPHARG